MGNHLGPDRLGHQRRLAPRETAHLHALRWEVDPDDDDLNTYLNLFDRFRFLMLRGDDTYPLWREMLDDPNGSLATAAYLEAAASVVSTVAR